MGFREGDVVTKYLDSNTFQVGGYSRAYADNWSRIFGKAASELKAQKEIVAQQLELERSCLSDATQATAHNAANATTSEDDGAALDVFAPAENTYERP